MIYYHSQQQRTIANFEWPFLGGCPRIGLARQKVSPLAVVGLNLPINFQPRTFEEIGSLEQLVENGNGMLRLRCATVNGTFDRIFAKYRKKSCTYLGTNA